MPKINHQLGVETIVNPKTSGNGTQRLHQRPDTAAVLHRLLPRSRKLYQQRRCAPSPRPGTFASITALRVQTTSLYYSSSLCLLSHRFRILTDITLRLPGRHRPSVCCAGSRGGAEAAQGERPEAHIAFCRHDRRSVSSSVPYPFSSLSSFVIIIFFSCLAFTTF